MKYDWNSILFKSGDLFLPTPILHFLNYYYIGSDTSLFYITNWTLIHFLSGVVMAKYFITYSPYTILLYTFIIHCIWEIWQIYGKNTQIQTLRGKVDVIVDTAAYMMGVWGTIQVFHKHV